MKTKRVSIEPATAADLPALVGLLGQLFSNEADFTPDRKKQKAGLSLLLKSPDTGLLLVARRGDEVVGLVSLLFTISTAEGGPVCWLEDLFVREDVRGGGIGSQLLESAVSEARQRGLLRITLVTDTDNETALEFYRKYDFARSDMTTLRRYLT